MRLKTDLLRLTKYVSSKLNLYFIIIILVLSSVIFSHEEDRSTANRIITGSRNYERGSSKPTGILEEGLRKYRKSATVDGNLVTGPIFNSGCISASEIGDYEIRIGWPKGTYYNDYIYGSWFFVASEVVDTNGVKIPIVSDNYGVDANLTYHRGQISTDGTHEWGTKPLPGYYNLNIPGTGDIPLVYGISEDVGLDGFPNTGDEGEGDGVLQDNEDFNGNGVLDLSMENVSGWFAVSHKKETWPEYWPAGSYPVDTRAVPADPRYPDALNPANDVRAGWWNGEYGKYNRADQESYYVMVDWENDEFAYFPFPGPYEAWPDGKRGLGITTEVRSYQWNSRLSEDILISIYEITLDDSAKTLDSCIVGMHIDPDLGRTNTGDDADYITYLDDITYTWKKSFISPTTGLPLGFFGFAFLESPGLSYDGVDNDEDTMIDESQTDGVDNDGDWRSWEDLDEDGNYDNEDVGLDGIPGTGDEGEYDGVLQALEDLNGNGKLDAEPLNDDVGSDGVGPDFLEYTGPDADGTEASGFPDEGEPNFEFTDNDESDQVGLTSFYLRSWYENPSMETDEHFWDFEIQPGTFMIVPDFDADITFTYGSGFVNFDDLERRHRYAIALVFGNDYEDILRNKRTMQVIYDNDYNFSKPPLQPTLTGLGDDGKVYLNWDSRAERSKDPIYGNDFEAYYIYKSTEPAFSEIKTITDAFGNAFLFKPIAIFDKIDSLRGLHPVNIGEELGPESNLGVTYDMGTDSGLRHRYVDTDVTNGRTYYYAVSSVDYGYHESFYPVVSPLEYLMDTSPTECSFNIQIDPLGRPISYDPNTVAVIPTERSANWVMPSLGEEGMKHISGNGTGSIEIQFFSPLEIKTGNAYRIEFNDNNAFQKYDADTSRYTGTLNRMVINSVTDNTVLLDELNPRNSDPNERFILEGFRLVLHNDSTEIDTALTKWESGSSTLKFSQEANGGHKNVARDYELRILHPNADSSVIRKPVNFQIWDVTNPDDQFKMKFMIIDKPPLEFLSNGDQISIRSNKTISVSLWEFKFKFPAGLDSSLMVDPQEGDIFKIVTKKTFDREDVLEFTLDGNIIDAYANKNVLDNIYTVPDPYVAVSTLERRVINEEEGRGDRRLDFVNLPKKCTVSIYTVSGKLIRELEHNATEENRRLAWDLRTKDGLEISYGMYFYVVDAPGIGTKTGKFAVIK